MEKLRSKDFCHSWSSCDSEQSRARVLKSWKSFAAKPSKAFAFHGKAVTVNSVELVYGSHGKAGQQSGLFASHQNSQEIILVLEQLIQLFCLKLMTLKEQLSQKTYKIYRTAKTAGLLPAQKSLEL
jgi:hypothetical protein